VRAEVANYLAITETLVSGRATVRYDIANAPVKELRVRVPAAFRNVDVTGANVRRRDQAGEEWRVELQSKVRGTYVLNVTWEMDKSATTNLIEFTGVQATNVEREVGYVIVSARGVQVTERSLGELLTKIDFNELPDWVERPTKEAVLAFKYLRPGYRLALEAKRYGEAEVLAALIDSARLTTVVGDDGQMMTELAITVRNNGQQHLEVALPGGSTNVWSAFVAGEPVRPNVRGTKLLLPLERSADDAPVNIELTFVSSQKFPKRDGKVALQSPQFDVPVKNARWDVYLPPDYDYADFEGSMTKIAESAPVVQAFSVSGYLSQQYEKVAASKAGRKSELSNVESNLRGGNVREAVNRFSKARSGSQAGDEQQQIVEIEKQVRRAQSSNLMRAQRDYFIDNNARFNGGQNFDVAGLPVQQALNANGDYDANIAELQWARLEAAQQVAKAKVTPLHIALPTRGVKLTFSQVLQTEVRKPMTVGFRAENTKEVGWGKRAAWSVFGFGVLWAAMARWRNSKIQNPKSK